MFRAECWLLVAGGLISIGVTESLLFCLYTQDTRNIQGEQNMDLQIIRWALLVC